MGSNGLISLKQGFVLMKFDYKDFNLVSKLEEKMTIGGIMNFHVPYADNRQSSLSIGSYLLVLLDSRLSRHSSACLDLQLFNSALFGREARRSR